MSSEPAPREEPRDEPKPEERAPAPYEPPRLTRVGNLRDLLGKTGQNFDPPNPHQHRP